MRRARVALAALAWAAALPLAAPAGAQPVDVSAAAGGVWITRLAGAEGTLAGPFGMPLPVRAELEAQDAPVVAAALAWRLSPRWEVRIDGAFARTAMRVRADLRSSPGGPVLLRYDFRDQGDARLWWGGAGAAVRVRAGGAARPRLDPYLLLQVGATHWDLRGVEELPELSAAAGDSVGLEPVAATLPAAAIGAGVDVRAGARVAVRVELVDVVGADPLEDEDFHLGSRFAGTVEPDDLVHTVRAQVGVRVRLR